MKYFYNLEEEKDQALAPGICTAHGKWIKGERLEVLLYNKEGGTGSKPHRHPEEQFIYILKGRLKAKIEDQEKIASPGEVIYIPSQAIHSIEATDEGDLVYFTVKDIVPDAHKSSPDQ